ncbi:hypothetical protein LXA43DRAFT_341766 [Ganoderma leucocontextum]|nr:hypothetical protein LXA43DRAFT_341766 [Ganoderma leucocontextum]
MVSPGFYAYLYSCIFSDGYHPIDEALLLQRLGGVTASSHRVDLSQAMMQRDIQDRPRGRFCGFAMTVHVTEEANLLHPSLVPRGPAPPGPSLTRPTLNAAVLCAARAVCRWSLRKVPSRSRCENAPVNATKARVDNIAAGIEFANATGIDSKFVRSHAGLSRVQLVRGEMIAEGEVTLRRWQERRRAQSQVFASRGFACWRPAGRTASYFSGDSEKARENVGENQQTPDLRRDSVHSLDSVWILRNPITGWEASTGTGPVFRSHPMLRSGWKKQCAFSNRWDPRLPARECQA